MLRALDHAEPHIQRLRRLLQNFRTQERAMTAVLHEMQGELEQWHREANWLRGPSPIAAANLLDRCAELQSECDLLAIELVHVRMAVAGATEELADHEVGLDHGASTLARQATPA